MVDRPPLCVLSGALGSAGMIFFGKVFTNMHQTKPPGVLVLLVVQKSFDGGSLKTYEYCESRKHNEVGGQMCVYINPQQRHMHTAQVT